MARTTILAVCMVASVAIVGLVITSQDGAVVREATEVSMQVSEVISEDAFITDGSQTHKVFSTLVELRAYCFEARHKAKELIETGINADHGLLSFITWFGKPLPSDDEKAKWTKAQELDYEKNPFNVAKNYNAVLADLKKKFGTKGLGSYLVKHLAVAVAAGKKVTTSDTQDDGTPVVRFSGAAFGLNDTPKYFKTLAIKSTKMQATEAEVITDARKAMETKTKATVEEKVRKMVDEDLDTSTHEDKAAAAAERALAAEDEKMRKKVAEDMAAAKKATADKKAGKTETKEEDKGEDKEDKALPKIMAAALKAGSTVALWNKAHKRFIRMPDGDKLDKSPPAPDGALNPKWGWERFEVIDAGNGEIALYNEMHNRFIRMPDGDKLDKSPDPGKSGKLKPGWNWERFKVVDAGNGEIALFNKAHNRYVRMPDGDKLDKSPDPGESGKLKSGWNWERFKVVDGGSGETALKAGLHAAQYA